MCRLLIIPGIKKDKSKIVNAFIKEMSVVLSKGNNDGLGYAAIDHNGNLFGERWWFNEQAFVNRDKFTKGKKIVTESFNNIKQSYQDVITFEETPNVEPVEKYNSFGTVTTNFAAITLHARMATSGREFANTHPFVDMGTDTSLVHNGVIRNHTVQDEIRSTCDSERILNKYLEHEVMNNPNDIQNMIDELKGYFACGIFTKANNKRVLDIFRTRASLGVAFVKELDTIVFSTKIEDVIAVCNKLNLTIVGKDKNIKEDTLIRIDPFTGKQLMSIKYTDTTQRQEMYVTKQYESNNLVSEADYQQITQEEISLMSKGYTLEGARQHIRNKVFKQNDNENVNQLAIDEINKVNKIIERNEADYFNQVKAAEEGWLLDEEFEMWYKKDSIKY